uniref:Mannosyltransferase n=1 Tax=Castor canadensis TaxID=51338 RepID=A0A8C0XSB3_CASCN
HFVLFFAFLSSFYQILPDILFLVLCFRLARSSGNKAGQVWAPEGSTAFKCLLSARLCAALLSNISDCDETFNYWEPTHFLIYGRGFQTWEYSPVYAIRSYAYLLLHAWPAAFHARILQTNKVRAGHPESNYSRSRG